MRSKLALLYAWFVRTALFFLPDHPLLMRLRGAAYSLMMRRCGTNFQVAHSAVLVCLDQLCVGSDVYVANNTVLLCGGVVTLEDEVQVAHNSVIVSSNHTRKNGSYRWGARVKAQVIIRKGSWVGANCTVTAGAGLGVGSVLAAGSVLTKDLDKECAVVGGVPARYVGD